MNVMPHNSSSAPEALSLCSNNMSSDPQVKGSLSHTSLKTLNVFWTAHQDYQYSCVFTPSIWNNWHWVLTVKPCSESLHILTHLIITVANGTSTIWSFFLILFFIFKFYFTILYWFCHTLTWIHHGCTCVPNPERPSHRHPHIISLGHPSAPAPSILYQTWTGDSFLIWYYTCFSILN